MHIRYVWLREDRLCWYAAPANYTQVSRQGSKRIRRTTRKFQPWPELAFVLWVPDHYEEPRKQTCDGSARRRANRARSKPARRSNSWRQKQIRCIATSNRGSLPTRQQSSRLSKVRWAVPNFVDCLMTIDANAALRWTCLKPVEPNLSLKTLKIKRCFASFKIWDRLRSKN